MTLIIPTIYNKIRTILFNNRKIPIELSKWYCLLLVLMLSLVIVLFFYHSMKSKNKPLYRQIHVDFNETANDGVGFVGLDFNLVPKDKKKGALISRNDITIDLGILPVKSISMDDIKGFCSTGKEVIVDSIMLAINGCGKNISYSNSSYDFKHINNNKPYRVLSNLTYLAHYDNGDSSYISEWLIYNGPHTLEPRHICVNANGQNIFYPTNKRPSDFNLFITINGKLKKGDSLFSDTSHIVLNFDSSSWTYDNIYPRPSKVSPFQVTYFGTDAVQRVLDNNGIYIQSKNENIRTKNQRLQYIYTIMISALLAFIFDILIRIVVLWHNGYLEETAKFNQPLSKE